MEKIVKTIGLILVFAVIVPVLAGWAVMALWNAVVTVACGFAAISFIQAVGMFVLGQILSGGVMLGLFFVGGGIHAVRHHHGMHDQWNSHWHGMTDEQRREFIEQRRRHFGFRHAKSAECNGGE